MPCTCIQKCKEWVLLASASLRCNIVSSRFVHNTSTSQILFRLQPRLNPGFTSLGFCVPCHKTQYTPWIKRPWRTPPSSVPSPPFASTKPNIFNVYLCIPLHKHLQPLSQASIKLQALMSKSLHLLCQLNSDHVKL